MIHGQQEITHHLTIETDASACFPSPRIDNSPRLRSCQIRPDQKVHRAGVATSASRETVECKVEHLKDGAKGNARQTKTNKVGVGAGGGVLAAGNILLALLVDQVLDWNGNDDGDLEIQLGALVEQTQPVRAGAAGDQVAEGATEHAGVDIGGVTGVGGLVAAGELSLVTALGLSLLNSHVIGDREADLGVALVSNTVAVANTTGRGADGRKSNSGGSEAEESGDSELHCDGGIGFEREKLGESEEDWTSEEGKTLKREIGRAHV